MVESEPSVSSVKRIYKALHLAAGIDPTIGECTSQESAALAAIAQKTRSEQWGVKMVPLCVLWAGDAVRTRRERNRWVYMTCQSCHGHWDVHWILSTHYGREATCRLCLRGRSICWPTKLCSLNSPHGSKTMWIGSAGHPTQACWLRRVIDLVFIDADKTEQYFQSLLDTHLLSAHGFICVDNTCFRGRFIYHPKSDLQSEAIARFNPSLLMTSCWAGNATLRDGLTIIRRL